MACPRALLLVLCLAVGCHREADAVAPIRIAFYNGGGTFSGEPNGPHARDFYVAIEQAATALSTRLGTHYTWQNVTQHTIAAELPGADVVIFPGGSGSGQASSLGPEGIAAVRSFVQAGGGYIGTCGGAFLAIKDLLLYGEPPHGPPTVEPWARGHGPVAVEFTAVGASTLKLDSAVYGDNKNVTIEYWQGPIVATDDMPASVTVLSFFRSEIHSEHTNETTGNMVNTPAMTSARYGKGRVMLNSPHPEIPPEHEPPSREPSSGPGRTRPEIYEGELAWVLRRDETLPSSTVAATSTATAVLPTNDDTAADVTTPSGCSVSLTHPLSSEPCVFGTSFSCFISNSSMWVSSGCRGVFTCNNVQGIKCDPCDNNTGSPTPGCGLNPYICSCNGTASSPSP